MMKKIFAFLLSFLLVAILLAPAVPTFAGEEESDAYAPHLVLHYDFKGDTVADALKDKATAGDVDDDLVAYSAANKNVDSNSDGIPDGTPDAVDSTNFSASFAVDSEKGTVTNTLAGASLQAVSSADTQKLFGTATWFFRFKIDDVSGGESWLLDMRYNTKSRRMLSISVANDGAIRSQAARTKDKFNTHTYGAAGTIENDVYINFVLVMQQGDGSSGYNPDMIFTPYYSIGTPTSVEDWTALTATGAVGFRTDGLANNPLCLFNRWDGAETTGNTGITLDDVRLYDTVLEKNDIAAIFAKAMANGDFDTTESTNPPENPDNPNPPVNPDTPEKPEPPVIPEKDENALTPNLGDHLLVHYDFQGATAAEALKDKATAGDVKDDLSGYSAEHKNTDYSGGAFDAVDSEAFLNSFRLDYKNGTVTNLEEGATLQAVSSTDIQKLYGNATWFFRFKLDEVNWSETRLLDMRLNNKGACMFSILIDTDGKIFTRAGRTASAQSSYTYSDGTNGKVTNQVYVNFALMMIAGNGSSGYTTDMKYIPYFSIETPEGVSDWITLSATDFVAFRTDGLLTNPLSLFDRWDGVGSNNTGLTIDDVRLYDTVLTKADLQAIIEAGGFANPNAEDNENDAPNDGDDEQNPNEQPDVNETPDPNEGEEEDQDQQQPSDSEKTQESTAQASTTNQGAANITTEPNGGCSSTISFAAVAILILGGAYSIMRKKD